MSRSTQGSKGSEGSTEERHTKRVSPARPDRFRHLLPRALVVACLAGGTCASLAADHEHAVAADASHPLRAVTAAAREPLPDQDRASQPVRIAPARPTPRQLVLLGRYPTASPTASGTPGTPSPSAASPTGSVPATAPAATPSDTASATPADTPSAAASPDTAGPAAVPVRPTRHRRRHHHRHHRRRHAVPYPDQAALPDLSALPEQPAQRAGTGDHHLDWHGLAHCEASNRPDAVDPSGTYGGLYQFDVRTWHSVGGHGLPQNAPAAEQTRLAIRLYSQRGSNPWPVCGPRLYG